MKIRAVLLALLVGGGAGTALAVDKNDAQRMLRNYKCFSCHAVTRKKEGPSYQEVAQKYSTHPNARAELYEHLTTAPIIVVDGSEEQHKKIEDKDRGRVQNLVEWILSHE